MRKNQAVRKELEMLYGAKCMLTDSKERLNYHHIDKKEHGGKETVENGFLINREAHDFLHNLENTDWELYDEIWEAIQCYKLCVIWGDTESLNEWEAVKEQVRIRVR